MMTVQEFIARLRTYLNDPQAIEFADTELISYINSGLRLLSTFLTDINSLMNVKDLELTVTDGEATIPSNFLKAVSVKDVGGNPLRYEIVGTTLRTEDVDKAVLRYHYLYPSVSNLTDTISIPIVLEDALFHFVSVLAKNRIENPSRMDGDLMRIFQEFVRPVAALHGKDTIEYSPPFVV